MTTSNVRTELNIFINLLKHSFSLLKVLNNFHAKTWRSPKNLSAIFKYFLLFNQAPVKYIMKHFQIGNIQNKKEI